MMRTLLLPLFCALSLSASPLLGGGSAHAQGYQEIQGIGPSWAAPENGRRPEAQDVLPVREIISRVRRQVGGDFVAVQEFQRNGEPPFYVLRWRFDNEVIRDLRVDARNGRVMNR